MRTITRTEIETLRNTAASEGDTDGVATCDLILSFPDDSWEMKDLVGYSPLLGYRHRAKFHAMVEATNGKVRG